MPVFELKLDLILMYHACTGKEGAVDPSYWRVLRVAIQGQRQLLLRRESGLTGYEVDV